tara:strand:+ start:1704 stop:2099 length:396 start_codon:yes stop_codon:yes gene_type:complete
MSDKRITNIDTLSALLDRLISENIKLYFFNKDGVVKDIDHQKQVIIEIKSRIKELLLDVYVNKKYDYISEKRTWKTPDLTIELIEQLIKSDIYLGETDRADNHKLMRSSNEVRAVSKNELDEEFKNLVEDK